MTWTMPRPIHEGRMYHIKPGQPYRWENSPQGVDKAWRGPYDSIDLDARNTKPDPNCPYHPHGEPCHGHTVCTHDKFPLLQGGFYDPLGKLGKYRSIESMTLPQVMRLRSRDGYRIHPLGRLLKRCAHRGLVASVEPKGRKRWGVWRMRQLWQAAHRAKCPTIIKSMWTAPINAAAHVGFQVRYTKDHKPGM